MICRIWSNEELPTEWKTEVLCPIHKRGNKQDCNNYRGIALLNVTYKVFSNCITYCMSLVKAIQKSVLIKKYIYLKQNNLSWATLGCIYTYKIFKHSQYSITALNATEDIICAYLN